MNQTVNLHTIVSQVGLCLNAKLGLEKVFVTDLFIHFPGLILGCLSSYMYYILVTSVEHDFWDSTSN